jgi:hypothetical protein
MRDTSEGMIEIIDAFQKDEGYFIIISVPKGLERKQFQFGVTPAAYRAVRRILQSRLLDSMPGLKYQYFWDGSMKGKTENKILLGVRCEVEQGGKSIDFEVPHSLAANLQWFNRIEAFVEAEAFKIEI